MKGPKPVRLFTIVFGKQFLDWFERACVLSLSWPKNREALKPVVAWDIWTTPEDAERASAIASKIGIPIELHTTMTPIRATDNLVAALIGQMQMCEKNDWAFLFASPDSIFGDGTIATLLEVGKVRSVCVAAAPLRVVSDGFLEAMGPGPVSNPELVKIGMERMHPGFRDANADLPDVNSFKSGVSWRKLRDGMYAVTFLLYSAYLMKPNSRDVKWFISKPKFGNYDHSFPRVLVEQERQRVIASSDAAFIVELTPQEIGSPPLMKIDPDNPDAFWQKLPHHAINRNVIMIWRAD